MLLYYYVEAKNVRHTGMTDTTDVFGVPAIGTMAGDSEGVRLRSAGALGAATLFGCLFHLLFGGFLYGFLCCFLHGFLCGLLGGFLCCFLRHNNSPENRGFRSETQAKMFRSVGRVRLQSH